MEYSLTERVYQAKFCDGLSLVLFCPTFISDLDDDVEWLTTVSDDTEGENSVAIYFQFLSHKKTLELNLHQAVMLLQASKPHKCTFSSKYKIMVTSNQDPFLTGDEKVK